MNSRPTNYAKKQPSGKFGRVVLIGFALVFIVVCVLVAMAWLTIRRGDDGRYDAGGSASAPQQGVEIWQPGGASATGSQAYNLPPAADTDASQASEPEGERPAAPRRAARAAEEPAAEEVPIHPVAPPPETEIRPIEVPINPVPQPRPRQSDDDNGGGNPVENLF